MPPKAGKEKAVVEEEEDVIQAVILADSFTSRFKPLSANKPRVRLLANFDRFHVLTLIL